VSVFAWKRGVGCACAWTGVFMTNVEHGRMHGHLCMYVCVCNGASYRMWCGAGSTINACGCEQRPYMSTIRMWLMLHSMTALAWLLTSIEMNGLFVIFVVVHGFDVYTLGKGCSADSFPFSACGGGGAAGCARGGAGGGAPGTKSSPATGAGLRGGGGATREGGGDGAGGSLGWVRIEVSLLGSPSHRW
jgi:hypothetical protein